VGNSVDPECYVEKVDKALPSLKVLEGNSVNVDELNYLARRLESFDSNELLQYQGAIAREGFHTIKDLINLTFCVADYAVISDFSDLEKVGTNIYFAQHGGVASKDELRNTDRRALAMDTLNSGRGIITPYGVVFKFDGEMEQFYDGRFFPRYDYTGDNVLIIGVASKNDLSSEQNTAWLYMPMPDSCIEKALLRVGETALSDVMFLPNMEGTLAEGITCRINFERETMRSLNDMCKAVYELDPKELQKLEAVVDFVQADSAMKIESLAKNLGLFDFIPDISNANEYGQYMIRNSGHFDYDDNLDEFYNYSKYGLQRMKNEDGHFTSYGYICYQGAISFDELLSDNPSHPNISGSSPQMGM
jgi:hypothetical protein